MSEGASSATADAFLERWRPGDAEAEAFITPTLYAELRHLASGYLRRERPGHTLQPTELVNEALIRLFGSQADITERAHLVALAARTMRQVLVDHARHKQADKRAPGQRVPLDSESLTMDAPSIDILELDRALAELARIAPRATKVVELRYFGGLTTPETSEVLGVSISSIEREWRAARAWLRDAMSR